MVDGLVERAADGRVEAVAGIAQLRRIEDEPAVGAAAADGRVRVTDGVAAARADVVEGRAGRCPDLGVGDGAATDERRVRVPGGGVAGGDRGEIEPSQPEGRAGRAGHAGRVGRVGARRTRASSRDDLLDGQDEDARCAGRLEPRQEAPHVVRPDHRVDRDHAGMRERDDGR